MLKRFSALLLVLLSCAGYAQDMSATVKTVDAVAPGKDFTVEVSINRAGISGFMKYFQDLPANYTAADIDSKGGNFSFADNGAKIIWLSPPAADQFTISYKVSVPAGATGTLSIGGKLSYVVGNERKAIDITSQTVKIGNGGSSSAAPAKTAPAQTQVSTMTETKPAVTQATSKPAETPKPAETVKPAEIPKQEPKKEAPPIITTQASAPATAAASSTPGRTYKVQIGAFSQTPHLDGVTETSSMKLDNGVTKYFSGNFKTYEEASKRRTEMISKGYQGAFIVAFENGKIVK